MNLSKCAIHLYSTHKTTKDSELFSAARDCIRRLAEQSGIRMSESEEIEASHRVCATVRLLRRYDRLKDMLNSRDVSDEVIEAIMKAEKFRCRDALAKLDGKSLTPPSWRELGIKPDWPVSTKYDYIVGENRWAIGPYQLEGFLPTPSAEEARYHPEVAEELAKEWESSFRDKDGWVFYNGEVSENRGGEPFRAEYKVDDNGRQMARVLFYNVPLSSHPDSIRTLAWQYATKGEIVPQKPQVLEHVRKVWANAPADRGTIVKWKGDYYIVVYDQDRRAHVYSIKEGWEKQVGRIPHDEDAVSKALTGKVSVSPGEGPASVGTWGFSEIFGPE